jgi:hypothetical protein
MKKLSTLWVIMLLTGALLGSSPLSIQGATQTKEKAAAKGETRVKRLTLSSTVTLALIPSGTQPVILSTRA